MLIVDTCNICGARAELEPRSSYVAPVTYLSCESCRTACAENFDVLVTLLILNENQSLELFNLKNVTTFMRNNYVPWSEFLQYFGANEADLRDTFVPLIHEEDELIDVTDLERD